MSWFQFPASCPHCDGPLRLINGTSNGSLMVGVFVCESCRYEWTVEARILPHRPAERRYRPRERTRA